jgi:hypothetical protein
MTKKDIPKPAKMKNEEDILEFLGVPFIHGATKNRIEIAKQRFVTEKSVELTISRVAKKLGISRDQASNQRVQLVKKVLELTGKNY